MPIEIIAAALQRHWRNGPRFLMPTACCALLAACQHTAIPEAPAAVVEVPAQTGVAASAPVTEQASEPAPGKVPTPLPVEIAEESLTGLLRYADQLRSMSQTELRQELNALGSRVPRTGAAVTAGVGAGPKVHMQFALALLQTREPVETARALGLLQRVTASTDPEARIYKALASLLIDHLITTRRLEDNLERSNQQLRESQRRFDALKERLDAMRAIERSMNAPPPNGPRPFPP